MPKSPKNAKRRPTPTKTPDLVTPCALCRTPIGSDETVRGAGGGAGRRFAHEACWWRREAERWEAAYRSLLPKVTQSLAALDLSYEAGRAAACDALTDAMMGRK